MPSGPDDFPAPGREFQLYLEVQERYMDAHRKYLALAGTPLPERQADSNWSQRYAAQFQRASSELCALFRAAGVPRADFAALWPPACDEVMAHKWRASEQRRVEVPLAEAAEDWIRRHGRGWLAFHGYPSPPPAP